MTTPLDDEEACPHDDWTSRDLGNGYVRFICIDCGDIHDQPRDDDGREP